MKYAKLFLVLAALLALFALGRWSASRGDDAAPNGAADVVRDGGADGGAPASPEVWTCPMHAQIKLPDPGDCPLCGMDLVLLQADEELGPRQLAMSPAARELAQVRVAAVERKAVTRAVRMVGKIDYDETAVRTISAWVPGRLDRLFVDYTGVRVAQGDHLVRLYSPELLTAQEELLAVSARRAKTAGEASAFLAESNRRAYVSAREKLLLWGLTEEQVAALEARGAAEDFVMLTSPSSGVVIDKLVDEGAYVGTGTAIYRIADLRRLWVRLDAYEQDLAWLRHGQAVTLRAEALPGELLRGTIAYIDPIVHEHTRTSKVRVNVDNSAGRLKPGMFVSAEVDVQLGAGGVVLDQALAGKWVSPMHPEIVKDGPGACDVCGMALVPAEELGLVSSADPGAELPLVVPKSALLLTGARAVAYVEVPDAEQPTYEGREVVLGPRAGDDYLVLSGLSEGERVVVNGAFRIDSSMQIQAKPSMMSMPAGAMHAGAGPGAEHGDASAGVPSGPAAERFRGELAPLYDAYLALQSALAGDDLAAARAALPRLAAALDPPAADALPQAARDVWEAQRAALADAAARATRADELEALRVAFGDVARAMLVVARELGHAGEEPLREAYCPMALGPDGAAWLQRGEAVRNPFYGAPMLECGDVRAVFAPSDATSNGADDHGTHEH